MTLEEEQQKLFEEIAALTKEECRQCRIPFSCCDSFHCEIARDYAKEYHNIDLQVTNFPNPKKLLFMSAEGCVVPPYLRPNCSLHTCSISSIGFNSEFPKEWTDKYFDLRNKIEDNEYKINKNFLLKARKL